MTYEELLDELEKLIGKKLSSIKPGAEITIQQVNKEQSRLILTTSKGQQRTRPLSEIKAIWEELCQQPAVHVDDALHGSGTSRNQPETILANLPYIEWFKYRQKKHIANINRYSHPAGTIKKMDEAAAELIREKLINGAYLPYSAALVVVTKDVLNATTGYEKLIGVSVKPVRMGIYKARNNGMLLYFITATAVSPSIVQGTYILLNQQAHLESPVTIEIAGKRFNVGYMDGLQVIVPIGNSVEVDNLF